MPCARSIPSLVAGALIALAVGSPVSAAPSASAKAQADAAASAPAASDPAAAPPASTQPKAAQPAQDASLEMQTLRASTLGVELVIQHFSLPNGLRVYVVEDHSLPILALYTGYDVGSRDEKPGRTGFAHLFEHMMFKGSANVPDGGHFRYVSSAGGEVNAYTTTDYTMYFNVIPSNHLEALLWLEADRMRSLEVSDENFENQRSAVLEELAMRYENAPYSMAFHQFLADVWKGSPYDHMPIGSKEDLLEASAEDARQFFKQHYAPNHAVMTIVGDVDPKEVARLVEQHFADIPAGPSKSAIEPVDHTPVPLARSVEDPLAQQAVFALGWKTVPEGHPDRPALELLFDILIRGDSSKIAKLLVDDKKLAIAAVPMASGGGRDAGAEFAAFIPVPGVSMTTILDVVQKEVQKIKKSGVSAKDLEKAVNQRTVEVIEDLAVNQSRAEAVARGALLEHDPTHVLSKLEKFPRVTPADIKRVAHQYLGDKTLQLEIQPASQPQ